jgi:hypothetical protein
LNRERGMQRFNEAVLCPLLSSSCGAEKYYNYGISNVHEIIQLVDHTGLLGQGCGV